MEDQGALSVAIKAICDEFWADRRVPMLLSGLPRAVEQTIPNYRDMLEGRSLKSFIQETSASAGYKLVEHPTQRARVGVIPATESYQFPEAPLKAAQPIVKKSSRQVTIEFFRVLGELEHDDLGKMVIPASILVKLLNS